MGAFEEIQERVTARKLSRAISQPSKRLARQARRRVELIRSRMPGARSLAPAEGERRKVSRILVLSDLHFGDPSGELKSPYVVDSLLDAISEFEWIDELVLLGDVFDFWKSPIPEAMEESRDFFSKLFLLENVGRIVYLPGNHDHHIFYLAHEELVMDELRSGKASFPALTMPLAADCPFIEALKPKGSKIPLSMIYPFHEVMVGEKLVLLTHGHLLGFFEKSMWSPQRSKIASRIVGRSESLELEDMEKFITPFYEMLTLSAFVPGVVDGSYFFYRLLDRTGKLLGLEGDSRKSTYRGVPMDKNAADVEALLDHFYEEKPDYFIYGHTHRAGALLLPLSGTEAINSGCWISDGVENESMNLVLEISEGEDEVNLLKIERAESAL